MTGTLTWLGSRLASACYHGGLEIQLSYFHRFIRCSHFPISQFRLSLHRCLHRGLGLVAWAPSILRKCRLPVLTLFGPWVGDRSVRMFQKAPRQRSFRLPGQSWAHQQ